MGLRTERHLHHRHTELLFPRHARRPRVLPRSEADGHRHERGVLRQADVYLPRNAEVHQNRERAGNPVRQVAVRHPQPRLADGTPACAPRKSIHTPVRSRRNLEIRPTRTLRIRRKPQSSVMKTAEEKGFAKGEAQGLQKGLQKGIEKGAANKALAIARQLKADGLTTELIAKYTGLSTGEIEKL